MMVYVENLSDAEMAVLQTCYIDVVIYNATGEVLNGTIDALAGDVLSAENLTGSYDVRLRVYGKTGLAGNATPIAFDLMFDLDPEVIHAQPGASYTVTLYDAGSGVANADVLIDGQLVDAPLQRISAHTWQIAWNSTLDSGIHRLRIKATDNADNLMSYDAFIIVS